MTLPLNVFQRLIRRWETVHPYNAAQVLRIAGPFEPDAVQQAWNDALRATGLGTVKVDRNVYWHEVLAPSESSPVRLLPAGSSLAEHLTDELNQPFEQDGALPFRAFLLPGDGSYHLGLVYRHWVADSVSIRLLLGEWFARLYDPGAARRSPLRFGEAGYWRLFAARRAQSSLRDAIGSLLRRHNRCRRARKVLTFGAIDPPVRVALHEAPPGLIDRLQAAARAQGLKVNDIFLAALAESCNGLIPAQHRRNRPDLAVAAIVDLRPFSRRNLADTFGMFLGFSRVICRPAELRDWPRLLRTIAGQTRAQREWGIALSSVLWLMTAWLLEHLVPDDKLYGFYRKENPLIAGLSNVNLNNAWPATHHPGLVQEYLRVSPTGPTAPVVVAMTTLGSRLHIAVTGRQALLGETAVRELVRTMIERLEKIAGDDG